MKESELKYCKFDPSHMGKYSVHSMCVKLTGKNKRVLEIGCATGYISERLKAQGCYVVGVEIDKNAAKIAKEICDKVIEGDIETIELPPDKFDVITCIDVLEHLKNPKAVLEKVTYNLKENGIIIISVPNIANWKIRLNLLLGNFNYTETGILDETHLRFFTYKTIKELIDSSGLKVIYEDISPSFPFPFPVDIKYKLAKHLKTLFAFQFVFVCKKKFENNRNLKFK